jgi:hypothetical protein
MVPVIHPRGQFLRKREVDGTESDPFQESGERGCRTEEASPVLVVTTNFLHGLLSGTTARASESGGAHVYLCSLYWSTRVGQRDSGWGVVVPRKCVRVMRGQGVEPSNRVAVIARSCGFLTVHPMRSPIVGLQSICLYRFSVSIFWYDVRDWRVNPSGVH